MKITLAYVKEICIYYDHNYYLSNQHLLLIFNLLLLSGSHILKFRKSELNTWIPNLQNTKCYINVLMYIKCSDDRS